MPRASNRSPLTGSQLQSLRKAAGLSGPALAKLLGVPYQTLLNIENTEENTASVPLTRLWILLTYAPIRQLVPLAEAQAKKIVGDMGKT